MKICVLFEGGMRSMGITSHLFSLVSQLHLLRSDIIVVHDGTEQELGLLKGLISMGVQTFDYTQGNLGELLEAKRKEGYNHFVFHAESYGGCRLIEPYKKAYNVYVLLGMNAYKYGSMYRYWVIKYIWCRYHRIVDTWVFFSQQARMEFCAAADVYDDTFVIPWGVEDLSKVNPIGVYRDVYRDLDEPYEEDVKYVFYAAQFHKHKNQDLLVSLLEKHLHSGRVKLMLGGNGSQMDRIHKMCVDLGVADNVVFLGRVPRRKFMEHMKNGFCSLVMSKNETFGHCILEPLQLGIPVISTPTGIAPTIITDFKNGFTIPLSNKRKWQMVIDELLEGKLLLKSEYNELYSWPVVAKLYNKLYEMSCQLSK